MAYSNFYGRFYVVRQQIAAALSAVWNFYPSRWYFGIVALLQLIAWYAAFFIEHSLSGDFLVLHYNVDFGIDLVGNPREIFFYPLVGLGVLVLNIAVAAAFYRHKDFRTFTHLLLGAAVIFSAFLNIALLFIYLINFR